MEQFIPRSPDGPWVMPRHTNCRCVLVPMKPERWAELEGAALNMAERVAGTDAKAMLAALLKPGL